MKKMLFVSLIILSTYISNAQIRIPEESQHAEVKQQIGFTEIEINYTRPNKKGRVIFGEMVPWGSVWRTGANANTKLSVSKTVFLEGNKIPKGKYGLYTIPEKNTWTVIVSKDTTLWGHYGYNAKNDLLRFKIKPIQLSDAVETMTFVFRDVTSEKAILEIKWGKIGIPIQLSIDTKAQDEEIVASITNTLRMPEDRDKPIIVAHDYLNSAMYYLNNDKDLNQALEWANRAIKIHAVNYMYLYKSEILGKLKRYDEAIETSKIGLAIFKNAGTNKEWIWRYESQINRWKRKK